MLVEKGPPDHSMEKVLRERGGSAWHFVDSPSFQQAPRSWHMGFEVRLGILKASESVIGQCSTSTAAPQVLHIVTDKGVQ